MGKRKGMALSEAEFIGIKNLIKIKCNDKKANELLNFINIMVKTGIRRAEWHILANAYNKYLTRSFEIIIPKQTKKNKMVKRLIKIPPEVFANLQNGEYKLKPFKTDWVYKKTTEIKEIILGTEYDRPLMPHDFRHTFIMMAKHRGWDMFDVKSVTQHASLKSLEQYYQFDTDIINAVYDSLDNDYYDVKNPAKMMKQMNQLKMENSVLKAKLEAYEKIEKGDEHVK